MVSNTKLGIKSCICVLAQHIPVLGMGGADKIFYDFKF